MDKAKSSTFFTANRSEARMEYEVSEPFKNKVTAPSGIGWTGTTQSGIEIQFYWDAKSQRTTFYPKGEK